MELSVVICTHNPRRDYLQRTVASLKAQDLDQRSWEFLIIDNASTTDVHQEVDLSWHASARIIREEKVGLTMARLRGISESVGERIVFVDDDNVLEPDYLTKVLALMQEHTLLGVIGSGSIVPEFEEQPAPELRTYLPMLALRSIPKAHWSNDPADQQVPWGAGMVVTRKVAQRYHRIILSDPLRQGLDRSGTNLNSCGDDEFSWVACEMGLGKGIFPELRVTHLIGRSRVQKEYLLRLAEGHAFSHALLKHLHGVGVARRMPPPSIGRLASRILRLRLSEARWEAHRLWNKEPGPSETARAFAKAREEGLQRFHSTVLR